ncbi:MAG: hypothetical protein AAF371_07470 [Pseudomonadota bacterium]
MDAGTLLVLAKLGAFALIVRAWLVARRSAEEVRAERARREAEPAPTAAHDEADAVPLREAA